MRRRRGSRRDSPRHAIRKPAARGSCKLASELPAARRVTLEALRTDSRTFESLVHMRRFRKDDWYKVPAEHVDVCNVPLPVRVRKE